MESLTFIKSKAFALRIVKLYKWLCEEKREYVLSKQLLRAGTSIGANLAEAEGGVSRPDFINKIHISLKECKESKYWIELLYNAEYINDQQFESINDDAVELEKMLTASLKSLKKNDS